MTWYGKQERERVQDENYRLEMSKLKKCKNSNITWITESMKEIWRHIRIAKSTLHKLSKVLKDWKIIFTMKKAWNCLMISKSL